MADSGYSQELRQGMRQDLVLLPRMLQSIEVLQLPAADLEGFLREAAQENEALHLEEPPLPPLPPVRRGSAEQSARFDAWLESQPGPDRTVVEAVAEQLALLDVDPRAEAWVRLVAGCLDESGYLSVSDEVLMRLAGELGLEGDEGDLGRAIAIVQGMEPRGIGGRDAIESVLLQLDPGAEDYELFCRLLEEYLEDVARNKLPAVARALGIDMDHMQGLLERLRELEIAPGARAGGPRPPPLRPDVVVEPADGGFAVRVERSGLPAVALDRQVQALARDRTQSRELRHYLRGKLDRARWLVAAVEQREHTLLRVATALFRHQRRFLEAGPGHLRPFSMSDLAGELGVHVSTVSRAVAGKHADTPWGILPLRHFFQGAVGGEHGPARGDVRAEVQAILAAENPSCPLADGAVVGELARRGVRVARRTVAKYREELGIPSSYRRRRF
ncbi:MAG: RNA polymerase factor sigma-54 [Planctomycetota bacterium]